MLHYFGHFVRNLESFFSKKKKSNLVSLVALELTRTFVAVTGFFLRSWLSYCFTPDRGMCCWRSPAELSRSRMTKVCAR